VIGTVVKHFRRKYRGWYLVWAILLASMGVATGLALTRWMHPAKWLVLMAGFAIVWFMPTPRWTLRSPPSKMEHPSWFRRRSNRYDAAVLGRLALGDSYSTDIWRHIGGSSGAIMGALWRLERAGLARSEWAEQTGGPARRRYFLTQTPDAAQGPGGWNPPRPA
jgi:hypothetical protein